MVCDVTNMAQELRANELRHAADRHMASVTLPDGQRRTTNESICTIIRQYFENIFTREPGLICLAGFPGLKATEAARFEGCITEDEVQQTLKSAEKDSSPGI